MTEEEGLERVLVSKATAAKILEMLRDKLREEEAYKLAEKILNAYLDSGSRGVRRVVEQVLAVEHD